jgi:ligand-binding sensor domain-containing protein
MKIFQFLPALLLTATAALPSDNNAWKTYTAKDGLADQTIQAAAVDKNDVKWFGTLGGVSCFDGVAWKSYTKKDGLAGNIVYSIIVDRNNAKWFGTVSGVSRFDGISWKTFTAADGLADDKVYSVAEDRSGALWFGTGQGLSRFDGKSWKTYTVSDGLARNSVQAIGVDHDGGIWVGSNMGGVSYYDGDSWYMYNEMKAYPIYSISINRNGTKWFCGSYGAASFDGLSWKFFTSNNSPLSNVFSTISDSEGIQWFGIGSHTLIPGKVKESGPFSFDGVSWKILPLPQPETNQTAITALAWDTGGDLWIGTSAGLYRYSPGGEHALAVNISSEAPITFAILGNYPNPFNPSTRIEYSLPERGNVTLVVYDIFGRKVRDLVSGFFSAGKHSAVWNGCDMNGNHVSSGVYFSSLAMRGKATAGRMLLVK